MDEQYLTINEVAENLKVTRVTVYNLLNAGKLESIKVGKARRITLSSFRRFTSQNRAEPTTTDPDPKPT